jgi:hypothetical protein
MCHVLFSVLRGRSDAPRVHQLERTRFYEVTKSQFNISNRPINFSKCSIIYLNITTLQEPASFSVLQK